MSQRVFRKPRKDASFQFLSPLEFSDLKHLCEVAKKLDAQGALPATSGNFSYKCVDENTFLITRSGYHKRSSTPSHFLRLSLTGEAVFSHSPKPSDETLLHAFIYQTFPQAKCVLHCHAREIQCLPTPSVTLKGCEILKAIWFEGHTEDFVLPVFKNSQDMKSLSFEIKTYFQENKHIGHFAFVLQNHGVYCFAESVQSAENKFEALLSAVLSSAKTS